MSEQSTRELAGHLSQLLTTAQAIVRQAVPVPKPTPGAGIVHVVTIEASAFALIARHVAEAEHWLAVRREMLSASKLWPADVPLNAFDEPAAAGAGDQCT